MGYYTYYSLKVKGVKNGQEANRLYNDLKALNNNYLEMYESSDSRITAFDSSDSCKWYDHETDMLKLSQKYPHMMFQLYGDGEEYDDFWYEYYQNGTLDICPGRIVYDEPVKVKWDDPVNGE